RPATAAALSAFRAIGVAAREVAGANWFRIRLGQLYELSRLAGGAEKFYRPGTGQDGRCEPLGIGGDIDPGSSSSRTRHCQFLIDLASSSAYRPGFHGEG